MQDLANIHVKHVMDIGDDSQILKMMPSNLLANRNFTQKWLSLLHLQLKRNEKYYSQLHLNGE